MLVVGDEQNSTIMQQQQQGGTQYGVTPPDMAPFASPGAAPRAHMLGFPSGADHQQQQQPPPLAEAASPISIRPPASRQNFDELVSAAVPANFADEDALAAGEEVERGGMAGNRWPRQETLALLKIRSDMDAAFRDANLKGPLWEDVSRKLAELGYTRSAKKCKEKFENVHKYYKRTKEGRAGRQDGKSYRFFTQLEALHSGATSSTTPTPTPNPTPISTAMASPTATVPVLPTAPVPVPTANPTPPPTTTFGISSTMPGPSSATTIVQVPPVPAPTPTPTVTPRRDLHTPIPTQPLISSSTTAAAAAGISFSSDTFSSSESETDDEEGDVSRESRKRKRGGESGGSGKMMAFFEGLMKQVMERQEAMQQRFLETIEKREQDRMIREEAWKRQEMARLNREHELLAQERAMAATRDAAVISFLQKISGQPIQMPPPVTVRAASPPKPSPPPPPPSQQQHHPLPSQQQHPPSQQPQKAPAQSLQPQAQPHQELQLQRQSTEIVRVSSSTELVPVPVPEPHEVVATGAFEGMSSSSRWPKSEVHALIKLRSGLEGRYQEAGPKGPLWEEISQGMQRLGYSRSAKRCKEKWENINKYFKKVKESNKKRPEDAKTCPYFHQLDVLYRKKLFGNQRHQEPETNPNSDLQERRMALPPAPQQQSHPETERKNGNPEGGGSSTSIQIQTSNGGPQPSFGTITMKKPEDIVKELMEQQHQQASMDDYDKMEEHDSDNIDGDDDDDDDDGHDDEERTMQYKIQFQGQNVGGGGGNASSKPPSAAAAGSFLAMVQ